MRIDPQQAASRITGQSPGKRRAKGALPPLAYIRAHGDTEAPSLYEFCEPDGTRILAPADSDLPPVLASYEKASDMPLAMVEWLQGYEQEIEWYQAVGCKLTVLPNPFLESESTPPNKAPQNMTTVGPLISCHWHQTAPYNEMTVFGDVACMTGCGATALSMLLFYWGVQLHDGKVYRRGCMAIPPYKSKSNKFNIEGLPAIPIFDYANLSAEKPTTDAQRAAIAQMMLYCGCAIKSDYTPGGTTSYLSDLRMALITLLRMGNPTIVQSSKGAVAFEQKIIDELKAGRPCLLLGSGSNGGHFFLCDGFNPGTGLFHFNWGWGGKFDGWFALSALTPSKYNFSANKKAIVGIQPEYIYGDVNGDGEVTAADALAAQKMVLRGKYSDAADVNNDGSVDVADVMTIVKESLKKEEP